MRDYYTRYPRTILWLVPGGRLTVAGAEGGGDRRDRVREIEIEPFYISKFPITNEQFEAFDPGFERSALSPDERDPAIGISWSDASEYARWYAEVSHKPMRLPSEVEWEYACRAGSDGRFFWGDDPAGANRFVWHRGNSGDRVPELAAKKANGVGLFGMLGGVWEWAHGGDGTTPVLRGGCFRSAMEEISCSLRHPAAREAHEAVGFRIVKNLR